MDVPIYYRCNNATSLATPAPVAVCPVDNATSQFYMRYLMKRAISAIKLTIPKYWPKNYIQYVLFGYGFGAIFNTARYGVIFQAGNLIGRDVFYQPSRFITANPLLLNLPPDGLRIGSECALVKLQPDYTGVGDAVEAFAVRLALAYSSWQMNTQNSKFAQLFAAGSKAEAATFEKAFDKIQEGNPAVATGPNLYDKEGKPKWSAFVNDLRANYIAPEISADMRSIINEFDSFVGIPNDPQANKRERVVVDQVNANNIETQTLLDLWVETLNEGFATANELFGLNCKAEKKYKTEAVENG